MISQYRASDKINLPTKKIILKLQVVFEELFLICNKT